MSFSKFGKLTLLFSFLDSLSFVEVIIRSSSRVAGVNFQFLTGWTIIPRNVKFNKYFFLYSLI